MSNTPTINDVIDGIKMTVEASIQHNIIPHNKIINEAIDRLTTERLIMVGHISNIDAQLGALRTRLITVE